MDFGPEKAIINFALMQILANWNSSAGLHFLAMIHLSPNLGRAKKAAFGY
jgi:hypothetical protein